MQTPWADKQPRFPLFSRTGERRFCWKHAHLFREVRTPPPVRARPAREEEEDSNDERRRVMERRKRRKIERRRVS